MTHPIPEAALAQHIAILGKTGSGKTYTAKGAVENLLGAGARVCIIDPTGAWHGLRSSATGKSAGFPVVIFGGDHADLPLAASHGEAMAEIIGTTSTPAIIDTSAMRVGERTRFFADFADALVRKNRGPLHLIIDEAHLFAPQGKVADPQAGAMLAAANNLVSLGRSRGLRIMLITQRPAKLHKDSLTQVETLIAMRLIAPQDRAAVEAWIKDNADEREGREILKSLATLPTGSGWIWAPELNILERVRFPKIRTFDSSRAPDGAEAAAVLAPIDRDAIAHRLEGIAADALANDPVRLKAEIARLRRELQAAQQASAADPEAIAAAEREGHTRGWDGAIRAVRGALMPIQTDINALIARFPEPRSPVASPPRAPVPSAPTMPLKSNGADHKRLDNVTVLPGRQKLPRAKQRILTALAQYPGGRAKNQVAVLAGYAVDGGGFNNALSSLRSAGFITGSGAHLQITAEGKAALGPYEPLPTGRELLQYWLAQLAKAERAALTALVGVYPTSIPKADLALQAGYDADGGGFNNALSRLRTLELIEGRGEIRASPNLFD